MQRITRNTARVAVAAAVSMLFACTKVEQPRSTAPAAVAAPASQAPAPAQTASPGECGGKGMCGECAKQVEAAARRPPGSCDRRALAAEALTKGTRVLEGVKLKESVPQWKLLESPQRYEGKTVRIEGEITGICPGMGCWAGLRGPRNEVLNLKVTDGEVDFREVAKIGQYAVGQGIFSRTGHHGAQVKITGAMISHSRCR